MNRLLCLIVLFIVALWAGWGAHDMWHSTMSEDVPPQTCLASELSCWGTMSNLHVILVVLAGVTLVHLLAALAQLRGPWIYFELHWPPVYLLTAYTLTFAALFGYWCMIRSESDNAKQWLMDPTKYWVMLYAWMVVIPTNAGARDTREQPVLGEALDSVAAKALFILLMHMIVDPSSELIWGHDTDHNSNSEKLLTWVTTIVLVAGLMWFWNNVGLSSLWAKVDLAVSFTLCAQLGWLMNARRNTNSGDISLQFDLLSTVTLAASCWLAIYVSLFYERLNNPYKPANVWQCKCREQNGRVECECSARP